MCLLLWKQLQLFSNVTAKFSAIIYSKNIILTLIAKIYPGRYRQMHTTLLRLWLIIRSAHYDNDRNFGTRSGFYTANSIQDTWKAALHRLQWLQQQSGLPGKEYVKKYDRQAKSSSFSIITG